ncbi:MAG: YdeI/OmpD-associated family protein [Armatimonadota bacterium]
MFDIHAYSVAFEAAPIKSGKNYILPFPGDPDVLWGMKGRQDACGTVNGVQIRGQLTKQADGVWAMVTGPAWWNPIGADPAAGPLLQIVLHPEGPLVEGQPDDIRDALQQSTAAIEFFYSIAPHYRKNWLHWVTDAKREETRVQRITQMVDALQVGQRDR